MREATRSLTRWSVCLCVFIYRYVMWYERGYQEFDKVVSATTTKLKGIAVTNCTELNITVPGGFNGTRIWDAADYVVPPQVNSPNSSFALCSGRWIGHINQAINQSINQSNTDAISC